MTAFPIAGSLCTVFHIINSKCSITAKMMKDLRSPLEGCENIIPVSSVTSPPPLSPSVPELQVRNENEVQHYVDSL